MLLIQLIQINPVNTELPENSVNYSLLINH